MKKLILTFLATVGIAVLLPATTLAAPAGRTFVTGTVKNNGTPLKNAQVTVQCVNTKVTPHTTTTRHTTTNNVGKYFVQFPAKKCPVGSTVTVKVKKGKLVGHNTGTVSPVGAKVNIAIVDVSVPELGLATAFGAATIGGAGFLVVRRRQLGGAKA